MPLINVKLIEDVFTPEQKGQIVERLTDAMVSIEGENMRGVTWVVVEEVAQRRLGHRRHAADAPRTSRRSPPARRHDAAGRAGRRRNYRAGRRGGSGPGEWASRHAGGSAPHPAVERDVRFERPRRRRRRRLPDQRSHAALVTSITVDPGGTFGWHSHPGPVLVTVAKGTLAEFHADGHRCPRTSVTAGQAFVESGGEVHLARNAGSTPVELNATFLARPDTTEFVIPQQRPRVCHV